MTPTIKIEDLRLKWAKISDFPEGWSVDEPGWALLHYESQGVARVSSLRLDDINQEYRLKLYRRLKELAAEGKLGQWTFYIPASFKLRVEDLVQGEFSSTIKIKEGPRLKLEKKGGKLHVSQKIRIMTVDDSRTMQSLIAKSLASSHAIEVVSQVLDPLTVLAEVQKVDPDILTLDIHMPGKNGVEVLRDLMRSAPRPAVLLTSLSKEDGTLVFEGLSAGAFEYIQKPSHDDLEQFRTTLESTLLAAFESRAKISRSKRLGSKAASSRQLRSHNVSTTGGEEIVLIGSSTGGTLALGEVLPLLPANCPPVVVVQHIPAVFSRALAESLNTMSEIKVVEAEEGMTLEQGHAYIAPGGIQLALVRRDGKLALALRDDPPVNRFKPSVDYLFETVTHVSGLRISAAVLTGMGRDGAQGLLGLKKMGAWTIAQDEATSVVYGMPRAAHEVGGDCEVLPLERIAEGLLAGLAKRPKLAAS